MSEALRMKPCEMLLSSIEDGCDDVCELFDSESISDDSDSSRFSSSSDLVGDENSSSSISSEGPLYELSSLMASLPIKMGLSKFFQGKSQSFTSLSEVRSIEDLAKKECPYRKRMRSYKSNGGIYMNQKPYYAANRSSRIISKKPPKNSCGTVLA